MTMMKDTTYTIQWYTIQRYSILFTYYFIIIYYNIYVLTCKFGVIFSTCYLHFICGPWGLLLETLMLRRWSWWWLWLDNSFISVWCHLTWLNSYSLALLSCLCIFLGFSWIFNVFFVIKYVACRGFCRSLLQLFTRVEHFYSFKLLIFSSSTTKCCCKYELQRDRKKLIGIFLKINYEFLHLQLIVFYTESQKKWRIIHQK